MIRFFSRAMTMAALAFGLPPDAAQAQEAIKRFGTGETEILLRSTTDIAILGPVVEQFTTANPELTVVFEQWGSNALFARSKADCATGAKPADAVFSSAVHHMVWLVNAACAQAYRSPATTSLPDSRRWRDELWGVTTEPAVIVYNKAAIAAERVPRSRFALLDLLRAEPEAFIGKIATYDIAASGLGFLFAFADSQEASTFGSMLEGFARVGAVATCCSAEIIDGVASGEYLIAYNVLGSYVESTARAADVGVILPEDYTLILSRGYLIPRGAEQASASARFLDYLLGAEARALLAASGLLSQISPSETGLPPSGQRPIALSPALLVALDANKREQMLRLWADALDVVPLP